MGTLHLLEAARLTVFNVSSCFQLFGLWHFENGPVSEEMRITQTISPYARAKSLRNFLLDLLALYQMRIITLRFLPLRSAATDGSGDPSIHERISAGERRSIRRWHNAPRYITSIHHSRRRAALIKRAAFDIFNLGESENGALKI